MAQLPPLVSVLMSVHNGERFLREAVDSVLSQTMGDFEFLVVDDGSTDRTAEILASYTDSRICVLSVPTNIGLVDALNLAAIRARGQLLARIDADDAFFPDKLEQQVLMFKQDPSLVLLATQYECIDDSGKVISQPVGISGDLALRKALLEVGNQFCHASIVMRTTDFFAVGAYRKIVGRYSQDYDLWLRIMERGHIDILQKCLTRYRIHGNMLSVKKLPSQRRAALIYRELAYQRSRGNPENLESAIELVDDKRATLRTAVASDYIRWLDYFILMGNRRVALYIFIKAIITAPFSDMVRNRIKILIKNRFTLFLVRRDL